MSHDEHVAGLGMLQIGIKHNCSQGGDDPGPGPHSVVRDVEPEHRQQPITLIARTENALRNVAAASRLRARIPERPPLQSNVHQKGQDRQSPQRLLREWTREIRKK